MLVVGSFLRVICSGASKERRQLADGYGFGCSG